MTYLYMSRKSVEIILYHANWCGHCVSFMPEWEKFVQKVEEVGNEYNGIDIMTGGYEEKEAAKMGNATINGKDITGFPTVMIALQRGKAYKEYDMSNYNIKRNSTKMLKFIKNICELL